ncbi:DUF1028 domain-containing protein [Paenibacillus turpanensis]|uniref:DUF1028 domain-containing protein n=1 Tax=Paenibacillus turpanensis TaxID=2689078 RepID=UPI00140D4564|nr:DUF1028 domain-containing protein [Paenibacillus turpanensis]
MKYRALQNQSNGCVNTFSIVGYDPETGEHGVAVASKFLSVGAVVPWAKAGVGAVATQSWANPVYGAKGLEFMAEGRSAEETMQLLVAQDEGREVRQAGFVDRNGSSATYTGSDCHAWAGGIAGPNFAVQGNILTGGDVVEAMAAAFRDGTGDLATRLLLALKAGDDAGGDSRGKQSAALLVVKDKGGYGGATDRFIDLRVDDHKEPVRELVRIFGLHQLYFYRSKPEDIVAVEGENRAEIVEYLRRLGYLGGSSPTEEEVLDALNTFQLIENFDERIQAKGFVDWKVVLFMKDLAARKDA